MPIKRIEITNFKSFNKLIMELKNFNVLIGANASGKSNFVKIFEFLRDIRNHGLENAISLQGGVEYLRNLNLGNLNEFSLVTNYEHEKYVFTGRKKRTKFSGVKVYEIIHKFSLALKGRKGYKISKDELILKCEFVILDKDSKGEIEEKGTVGTGEIVFLKRNGKLTIKFAKPNDVRISEDDFFPPFSFYRNQLFPSNTLLIEDPPLFFPLPEKIFGDVGIYDIDPKLPKKATPITGKAELETDGSNLAIVLKKVISDKQKKRKLLNLLNELLPFVSEIDVEKFADKSLLFKLKESFCKKDYVPASLISDGTVNLIALIIALFFEKRGITIIEEPERNIHPYLLAKVVEMMKESSRNKQIIVTTHNPEFIKFVDRENLLLVERDKNGFSQISRPDNKEEVVTFLENEIGIDELFVQGLLER